MQVAYHTHILIPFAFYLSPFTLSTNIDPLSYFKAVQLRLF